VAEEKKQVSKTRRRRATLFKAVLALILSPLLVLFALFSLLEAFPALLDQVDLRAIRYYDQKTRLVTHPTRVFVHRHASRVKRYVFNGDLDNENDGIEPLAIPYLANFNAEGFPVNSSPAPVDVVVFGDSFIEIGESDDKTFTEILKGTSSLATYNLGKAWYGPYQYNELLRQYGPKLQPRYAVFCFFDGNDVKDIEEYEDWLAGGDYYHLRLTRPFLSRFSSVLGDLGGLAKSAFTKKEFRGRVLGILRLGDREVRMKFGYWSDPATKEELLQRPAWKRLRPRIAEFKRLSLECGATPILVFLPLKIGVYGVTVSENNEAAFLERVAQQLRVQDESVKALQTLTDELGIRLIDVTPEFRRAAQAGELLYYPADTHWNVQGRQKAARIVADALRESG